MASNIESQVESAKRLYDGRSENYNDSHHPAFAKYTVEYLNPSTGASILDLACGTGLVTFAAAEAVGPTGSVLGVDVSEGMLSIAYKTYENLKGRRQDLGRIDFINHDIADLDSLEALGARRFDAIICCSALVLLNSPIDAVKQWTKYLKPGGRLITDATHPKNLIAGMVLEKTAVRLGRPLPSQRAWSQSANDIKGILEAAGLEIEDVHLQEQLGFGKRFYKLDEAESFWHEYSVKEIGKPLLEEHVRQEAKAIFLEEWKRAGGEKGAVEEVDGVFMIKGKRGAGEFPKPPIMAGSCACGSTKWSAAIAPEAICHCQCSQCRKLSGGVLTSMEFPFWAISFSPRLAELAAINLSPIARRFFCGKCGSTMAFRSFLQMEHIEIAMGSLDEQTLQVPIRQILDGARKSWCFLVEKPGWWTIPDDGWTRWERGTPHGVGSQPAKRFL